MIELFTQISEVAYIRPGSGGSSEVMPRIIAAILGVEAFVLLDQNPQKRIAGTKVSIKVMCIRGK